MFLPGLFLLCWIYCKAVFLGLRGGGATAGYFVNFMSYYLEGVYKAVLLGLSTADYLVKSYCKFTTWRGAFAPKTPLALDLPLIILQYFYSGQDLCQGFGLMGEGGDPLPTFDCCLPLLQIGIILVSVDRWLICKI